MLEKSAEEIEQLVTRCLHEMLKFPREAKPEFIHISRHQRAIPQYGVDSGERFAAVSTIEGENPGLVIAGNLRDGIGMGHRITQAANIVQMITQKT